MRLVWVVLLQVAVAQQLTHATRANHVNHNAHTNHVNHNAHTNHVNHNAHTNHANHNAHTNHANQPITVSVNVQQKLHHIQSMLPQGLSSAKGKANRTSNTITPELTGHFVRKSIQDALSPMLVLSEVSGRDSAEGGWCLEPWFCYEEAKVDLRYVDVHHQDLPERSAAACGELCAALRPDTQLVFCKVIEVNERLVCGCGEYRAIVSGGELPDTVCRRCPDSEHRCGDLTRAVSVYELSRDPQVCEKEQPSIPNYLGCYHQDTVPRPLGETQLSTSEGLAECVEYCSHAQPTTTHYLMQLTTQHLYCGCGGGQVADVSEVAGEACLQRCPQGHACGGQVTYSVYTSASVIAAPTTLLALLAVYVTVLCA